jgi:hypothetical protein
LLAQTDYGSRLPVDRLAAVVDAGRASQPRYICPIDRSDNLLAGLLRGASLSPRARGGADRTGQATLYLPAAWPTRAAAAKRERRRLAMSAIGMDPHGLRPAAAKGRTRTAGDEATRRKELRSTLAEPCAFAGQPESRTRDRTRPAPRGPAGRVLSRRSRGAPGEDVLAHL